MNQPWSKIRKRLEHDFLCDSLKGRVRYFNTHYRGAHDQGGRICIIVDNEEKLNLPFTTEWEIYQEVCRRKDSSKSLRERYNEVTHKFDQEGIFSPWDFGYAAEEYFKNSIDKSLQSENMLVRMFAILDRRVGKRTLENLKLTFVSLPDWLSYFYELRIKSEEKL